MLMHFKRRIQTVKMHAQRANFEKTLRPVLQIVCLVSRCSALLATPKLIRRSAHTPQSLQQSIIKDTADVLKSKRSAGALFSLDIYPYQPAGVLL